MSGQSFFGRWFHRAESAHFIHTILHSEFVRIALWPTFMTSATALGGFLQDVPVMWIFMSSTLTCAGVMALMLWGSQYAQRRSPNGKLRLVGPQAGVDVVPPMATKLRSGQQRTVQYAQLGVLIHNTATFPLSFIVQSAESSVEGVTPPRTSYPRPATEIPPGMIMSTSDERMDMNEMPIKDLQGKLSMRILYGLKGREHLALDVDITVAMRSQGDGTFGVVAGPSPTSTT